MESSYMPVRECLSRSEENWRPFLRQLHIGSALWSLLFMIGLSTGAPTVFVPQIRQDTDLNISIDDDLASWIYSLSNFSAIPWVFVLPSISRKIGKKGPYIAACAAMDVVFLSLYFTSSSYHLITAQIIQGFANAVNISINIKIIPEYVCFKYRSMFLNIQTVSFYWGMWAANAIGTYLDWRYISILGIICSIYSFTVISYPESPHWLASKARYEETEAAHVWLNGTSPEAKLELREIIQHQLDYQRLERKHSLLNIVSQKQFYCPILLSILLIAQYNFSGKFVCSIYAIDIIKRITENEGTAYTGMLVLDGVTIFGMYIGCFLSKFKLRSSYLVLSVLSIVFMSMFSLYLFLCKLGLIRENNFISLGLLVVYSLTVSCGPTVLCITIYSEIVSVKYQAVSFMITSFIFLVMCSGMLKMSPILFKLLGIHGCFTFFAVSFGICTLFLYIYLPETQGKTLLEIEECFKDQLDAETDKLAN